MEKHLRSCDHTLLPCTNKCTKNDRIVTVLFKDLQHHLTKKCPRRQHRCPHCKVMGEYQERTTSHLETCPKVKIQCPNDLCRAKIPRCEVSTHQSTCDYESVSCKYAEVGCEGRPLRKELKEHEEDAPLHLQVTTKKVLQLTQLTQVTTEKVLQLTQVLRCAVTSPFTFKLTNFQKRKHDKDEFYSTPFYTSRTGYKMCVNVDANGIGGGKNTHVSVFTHLMKGDNDDSLTWPFTGEVTVEILNQLEDNNHDKATVSFLVDEDASKRVVDGERGTGWGRSQFISHADLDYQPDKNCQYLLNDTLVFQVSVRVNKPWLVCTA